jgi:hypothetical protein
MSDIDLTEAEREDFKHLTLAIQFLKTVHRNDAEREALAMIHKEREKASE